MKGESEEKQGLNSPFLDIRLSVFENEEQVAYAWVAWVAFYWTLVVWIPNLVRFEFDGSDFGIYVYFVGLIGLFASGYSVRAGLYPSGAIRGKPGDYTGRGRFSALLLVICLSVDLIVIAGRSLDGSSDTDDYVRASCHFVSLIWASLFHFNRFRLENPHVAWEVFVSEWFDIVFTLSVIFALHNASDGKGTCFNESVCVTYFTFFIVQVLGWLLPMIVIEGWGSHANASVVSIHLAILDFLSDFPIAITVVATHAYSWHPIIFIDCIYKSIGFIRSSAYYTVYYVWLNRGLLGLFRPDAAKASAQETQKAHSGKV